MDSAPLVRYLNRATEALERLSTACYEKSREPYAFSTIKTLLKNGFHGITGCSFDQPAGQLGGAFSLLNTTTVNQI
jgi:hypothetical protein